MEFDSSRRLFLRRGGLAAVAPVIIPVLPVEKIIKYFFAPIGGWNCSSVGFSSVDLSISIDDFSRRYLEPAMMKLAMEIEADAWKHGLGGVAIQYPKLNIS